MKAIRANLNSNLTALLLILLVLIVAFGILIPSLGFYWDDWPVIFMAQADDPQVFTEFYSYDRPFSAWTYILSFPLLGLSPQAWHAFTLLLRWLTVAAFYFSALALWPQQRARVFSVSLLFSVYPVFFLQSNAVAFSQHFITYFAFFVSFAAMLWALRLPRYRLPLIALALVAEILHLATMEYFFGLELLRPFALFALFREGALARAAAIRRSLKAWLPYLAGLLLVLYWRFFVVEINQDPNLPTSLASNSFGELLGLLQTLLTDLLNLLLFTWFDTLGPQLIDFFDNSLLFSWALAALVGLGIFIYLRRTPTASGDEGRQTAWINQAMLGGLLALLFALIPVWGIGRNTLDGLYADRFALAAMPGAALMLVAIIEKNIATRRTQQIVFAILIALSIAAHLRVGFEYRAEWTRQQRFYDQLIHRAPNILPGTALILDGAVSPRVADYSAATAINTLYSRDQFADPSLWLFHYSRGVHRLQEQFSQGVPITDSLRYFSFSGNTLDSLVFFNRPDDGACFWLLTPDQLKNIEIPEELREIGLFSNLDRITAEGATPPSRPIFDLPLEPYWCQYFQRASLAAQNGDWEQVLSLQAQASAAGFNPNRATEWLPFVQAHAALGDWPAAADLTLQAYKKSFTTQALYCDFWDRQEEAGQGGADFQAAYGEVAESLQCP